MCKLKTFLTMALAACIGAVSAQTLQVTSNAKGKLGYKDAQGGIVIKCVYDYAEPFGEGGLAKVGKGEKYGLIRTDGSFALPMEYSDIEERKPGHPTRVRSGKNYGLIDPQTGSIVLKAEYSFVSRFNCYGLAWFTDGGKMIKSGGKQGVAGGKMGIIDKYGKVQLTPQKKGVFEFSNKTSFSTQYVYGEAELLDIFGYWTTDTLKTDCQLLGFTGNQLSTKEAGVMDINGKEIVKEDVYTWISKPVEGIMRYWNTKSKSVTYGYLDINTGKTSPVQTLNQPIKEIKVVTNGDFYGNIAPVNSTEGWYFMDREFNKKESGFQSIKFEKGKIPGEGFFAGIAEGKSVVYRTDGTRLLSSLTISDVSLPNCDYGASTDIAVKQNGKWGLYDINGKTLLQPKYDYLSASYHGLYFYMENKKFGAVDSKGKVLVPAKYSNILYPKEDNPTNVWVMTADSTYYNYDIRQQKTLPQGYKDVSSFKDGMALASPLNAQGKQDGKYVGKYVLVDKQNKMLVSKPFPLSCAATVKEAVRKNGGKALTQSEANKLVLSLTRGMERHDITKVIPEEGWDY